MRPEFSGESLPRDIDTGAPRPDPLTMAGTVTLEFIAKQLERVIADQVEMRDDMRVLTAIVLRCEDTLKHISEQIQDMLGQMRPWSHSTSASAIGCPTAQVRGLKAHGLRTDPPNSAAAAAVAPCA
jgi:hypothetical protein